MYHLLYPQKKTRTQMMPVYAALLFQLIYLMLHVFLIPCMGYVTSPMRLAPISVHCLPTLLTTRFDLDPKQERIQVHIAQTMNL